MSYFPKYILYFICIEFAKMKIVPNKTTNHSKPNNKSYIFTAAHKFNVISVWVKINAISASLTAKK